MALDRSAIHSHRRIVCILLYSHVFHLVLTALTEREDKAAAAAGVVQMMRRAISNHFIELLVVLI